MRITRTAPATVTGPADWFTGTALLDEIAVGEAPSRLRVHSVHFLPGARTAWHRHPVGQVLHITEGAGLIGRRGAPAEAVAAGDTVWIEPGEWHWHGAAPTTFMSHLAIQEADADGAEAEFADHVTDADYLAAPAHAG